jgi:hypothetical protein
MPSNVKFVNRNEPTQCELILSALKQGEQIEPMLALNRWGCARLASRICDLRSAGFQIKSRWGRSKRMKRFSVYYMTASDQADARKRVLHGRA